MENSNTKELETIKRDSFSDSTIHSKTKNNLSIAEEHFAIDKLVIVDGFNKWGLIRSINKKKKEVFVRIVSDGKLIREWFPFARVQEVSKEIIKY